MSIEVTLLVRAGCHLCAAAEADLARILPGYGLAAVRLDVDADPALRAEYADRVPVVLLDGAEHGYWEVEEDRLRAALRQKGARPNAS